MKEKPKLKPMIDGRSFEDIVIDAAEESKKRTDELIAKVNRLKEENKRKYGYRDKS
ncbi:hypothetical protein N781_04765 [Pontibacillus halophilus JSM 076056 = DSM 19796]|uniref:Uncharacterized protein n=1 Tax=Pontibacillus halophilus JSM 076056 = DSM 19796 TaxID=1385510 RepID=A0A0A5GDX8_9BACI|nr:hypothetical protein [Pontibacillus halophilus]KGX91411.1 hypothetical protein N781_04765 [Pontibacillus halophilus JSM 076056 = DSM 19796]